MPTLLLIPMTLQGLSLFFLKRVASTAITDWIHKRHTTVHPPLKRCAMRAAWGPRCIEGPSTDQRGPTPTNPRRNEAHALQPTISCTRKPAWRICGIRPTRIAGRAGSLGASRTGAWPSPALCSPARPMAARRARVQAMHVAQPTARRRSRRPWSL